VASFPSLGARASPAMWALGLLVCSLLRPGLALDYDHDLLLDRLLNEAYPPPASYEDMPEYADLADYAPAPAAPQLRFPALSARQKQFGVNPGLAEFRAPDPDFLQYRLEELDTNIPSNNNNMKLEEELRSILGGAEPGAADKRGMLAAARTAPLIEEAYGETDEAEDFIFTSIVAGAAAASVFVVLGAGYCYHRSVLRAKGCEDVEYPQYGVTGPAKDASPGSGDRRLAQSAQMYHYQHQKNQMIAINRTNQGNGVTPVAGEHDEESEAELEGEGEEGDYTVYECPGLASTDEMEVKNPLFNDDPTPKLQ